MITCYYVGREGRLVGSGKNGLVSFTRFYEVQLQPALEGDWTIILVWGQCGAALGW